MRQALLATSLSCALAAVAASACAPARAADAAAEKAAGKSEEAAAKEGATKAAAEPDTKAAAGHSEAAGHKREAEHEADHEGGHGHGCPICPVSSPAELDVLMTLREHHAQVAAREQVLQQREAALGVLEQTLDARVAKLDTAMNKLEERLNLGAPGRALQEKRIEALVETLGGLSVKKAAPILAEADPPIAAELLRRVGAARAAALLTVMPPAKAGRFISLGISVPAPKTANGQDSTEAKP